MVHRHSSLVSVHHSVWHTRSPRCASPALLHLPFRTQSSPSSLPPVRLCEHCAVHRTVSVHQAVSQETLRPLTLSRAPKWLGCRPRRDRGFRVVRSSVDPTRRVRWGSRGGPRQPSADSPPWAETWCGGGGGEGDGEGDISDAGLHPGAIGGSGSPPDAPMAARARGSARPRALRRG